MEPQEMEQLMKRTSHELLREWYDAELKQSVGGSADDLVGVVGDMRAVFLTWCQRVGLNELVCNKWNYHDKKKVLLPAHLALALGEYLISAQGYHIPVPATTAAIIVLWAGDELCDGA